MQFLLLRVGGFVTASGGSGCLGLFRELCVACFSFLWVGVIVGTRGCGWF